MGHICMGHRDDSFLLGYEYTACKRNVQDTVDACQKLGFVIHPVKSVFIPTQEIVFLGFLLNSILTTIRLPPTKAAYFRRTCQTLLLKTEMTIRETAQVIGLIVSSLPAVQFGELYYRNLEKNKVLALQASKGNYEAALYLLGFNDLGCSVTPTFLFRNRFYLQLSPHCPKMNKKSMWEVKKNPRFLSSGHGILPFCGCKAH